MNLRKTMAFKMDLGKTMVLILITIFMFGTGLTDIVHAQLKELGEKFLDTEKVEQEVKAELLVESAVKELQNEKIALEESLNYLESENSIEKAKKRLKDFKEALITGNLSTDVSLSFRYSKIVKKAEKMIKASEL